MGSLRGVLIHDALLREARERGLQARFTYGCDDMDPVDEIPHGTGEYFREHLGKPLCRAPAPSGLPGDSMAQAYFDEFTSTFDPLGVDAEFYFMSEVYRSGRLDDTIDAFLRAAAKVREIYLRETGSVRPEEWLPFQPVCERCGRIGTTFGFGLRRRDGRLRVPARPRRVGARLRRQGPHESLRRQGQAPMEARVGRQVEDPARDPRRGRKGPHGRGRVAQSRVGAGP